MNHGTRTLGGLFGLTDFLMDLVLEDLDDARARTRSRGGEGPSIAWIVGHLLSSRYQTMGLLGAPHTDPFADRFGFAAGGATDGADYPTVAELDERWREVSGMLRTALSATTDEALDTPAPGGGPHEEESVRDKVVFFAWHEAYHVGALGALRKELGLPGPAEKVMALREDAGEG